MLSAQRAVKPGPFQITGAGAGEQNHNAGTAVVIQGVFKHSQLQETVGHFLLAPFPAAAVE